MEVSDEAFAVKSWVERPRADSGSSRYYSNMRTLKTEVGKVPCQQQLVMG